VLKFSQVYTFRGLGLGILKILKCITFVSPPPYQVGGPLARSLTPACQTQRPGKLRLCLIFLKLRIQWVEDVEGKEKYLLYIVLNFIIATVRGHN